MLRTSVISNMIKKPMSRFSKDISQYFHYENHMEVYPNHKYTSKKSNCITPECKVIYFILLKRNEVSTQRDIYAVHVCYKTFIVTKM